MHLFQNAVLQALKLDREFVDGRPMFVSRCEDRSIVKNTPLFKVSRCIASLYVRVQLMCWISHSLQIVYGLNNA